MKADTRVVNSETSALSLIISERTVGASRMERGEEEAMLKVRRRVVSVVICMTAVNELLIEGSLKDAEIEMK